MPRPLAPALQVVADRVMPATLLAEVQRVWPEAAGPALAGAAEPVSEREGVVTVACGSGVWAQELDLLSERVVASLNDRLGRPAVRRLRPVATPVRR
jgi:predicted nucleic acid-binding Zn ribbon protein